MNKLSSSGNHRTELANSLQRWRVMLITVLFLLTNWMSPGGRAEGTTLPEPQPPFTGIANRTLAGSTPQWPTPVHAPKGAPNVVLILVDDAGFGNPSAFGGLTNTPNLEQLASEGLRYNRFHVTAL